MAETLTVVAGDSNTIAYDVQGSGPAVMLITGFGTHRGWWHESGYVEALAEDFTVICPDPLGHGDSDKPHDPVNYSEERLVEHTVAVLDALGVDQCHVWGYSRGALIAAFVGWAYPERVQTLVLGGVPITAAAPSVELGEALMEGNWDVFWDGFPVPVDEAGRELAESTNDPRALGATLLGRGATHWRAFDCPVVGYLGDGEDFLGEVLPEARRLKIPMAVLATGGHMETFFAAQQSLELVRPFLGRGPAA